MILFCLAHVYPRQTQVRSITCWTLGRYCKWLVPSERRPEVPGAQALLDALVNGLLLRVADTCVPGVRCAHAAKAVSSLSARPPTHAGRSKPVQAAACCALATLTEEAGSMLVPHLERILQQLVIAVGTVRRRVVAALSCRRGA